MKLPSRVGTIQAATLLFAAALVIQAGRVQLWQGEAWSRRAERQHFTAREIPAPRGDILDAAGEKLAQSRELVRLYVAPRELRDRRALVRALASVGVKQPVLSKATDRTRAWVPIPGRFLTNDVARITAMRGVYTEPVIERIYAPSEGARRLVGRATPDGRAIDGLELALDTLLAGTAGKATMLRDARGRRFESPTAPGIAPTVGHSVTLTLNSELQEICDRALADAVARMGAVGGDIVMLNPHDGSILAVASRRLGSRVAASTAFTEPFEPGSTLKPFTAAALLSLGRAKPTDRLRTFGGTWSVNGRTITDEHPAAEMSLAEVIGHSSNIGIARFAERLSPREQFEALRDFGFGTPTGVPYPSESSGKLRLPGQWSKQSSASLAMGYEIAVTPIQLAAAYASIANGGELLEPALVKEIRSPDGDVRYRHERRVVRRVMSQQVAEEIRKMLVGVVRQGTARKAELSTFAVAGKTGTARRFVGTSYAEGQYTASFVGLFPADDPQYVIVVKLDDPKDSFGGQTAAPVTKVILEAAIAAPQAALDRGSLARLASAARLTTSAGDYLDADDTVRSDEAEPGASREDTTEQGAAPYVVTLAARPRPSADKPRPRAVPDVSGMPLRSAVRTLHRAGFRVQLAAGDGATLPAAGTVAPAGSLVRLQRDR